MQLRELYSLFLLLPPLGNQPFCYHSLPCQLDPAFLRLYQHVLPHPTMRGEGELQGEG